MCCFIVVVALLHRQSLPMTENILDDIWRDILCSTGLASLGRDIFSSRDTVGAPSSLAAMCLSVHRDVAGLLTDIMKADWDG